MIIIITSITLVFHEQIKSFSFFFHTLLIGSGSYITSTRYFYLFIYLFIYLLSTYLLLISVGEIHFFWNLLMYRMLMLFNILESGWQSIPTKKLLCLFWIAWVEVREELQRPHSYRNTNIMMHICNLDIFVTTQITLFLFNRFWMKRLITTVKRKSGKFLSKTDYATKEIKEWKKRRTVFGLTFQYWFVKKRSIECNWGLEELWFPSLQQVQRRALLRDQENSILTA